MRYIEYAGSEVYHYLAEEHAAWVETACGYIGSEPERVSISRRRNRRLCKNCAKHNLVKKLSGRLDGGHKP